jgi:hypothetical protein
MITLTPLKTVHRSVGSCTALIRNVQFKWQEVLQSIFREYRIHSQEAAISCPQMPDAEMVSNMNET